jgi:hypothetical protein
LRANRKKTKGKLRTNKWKYYLIVYDLCQKDFTYKNIANTLTMVYPGDKDVLDEKNIENYYGRALALINGGYKKYI